MGIHDENLIKCKDSAEAALLSIKDHAKNLDRNFEEIMNFGKDVQSFRLSSFLAGFVCKIVHNSKISESTGWWKGAKLDTANISIQEVMTSYGYRIWNLEKCYKEYNKPNPSIFMRNFSFYQGGEIIANRTLMNDRTNTLHNLTIFLDTLEAKDGHYIDGVSFKNGILGNFLTDLNSQSKPKIPSEKNTKNSNINENFDDDDFYLTATKEVEGKDRKEALWAKCMAIHEGDEKKAKYNYINKRVEILKKELADEIKKREAKEQEAREQEQEQINKTAQEKLLKESNEQKIRREIYLKLLNPFPEDKSNNVDQELAEDNLFPRMMNSSRRLILINTFNEKVNKRLKNL